MQYIASNSLRDECSETRPVIESKTEGRSVWPAMEFDIVMLRELPEIMDFSASWKSITEASKGVDFFQSWEWCCEYLRHCQRVETFSPLVIVALRGSDAVAVLPLCVQKRHGLSIVTGFTEPFQQYSELLTKPGVDSQLLLQQITAKIKESEFDLVHLSQVRDGSNLQQAMGKGYTVTGELDAAPSVPLSQWSNFEEYFTSVKAKTRKNMRNARNKLEKQGTLTHHVYKDGKEFADLVHRTFRMRKQWLEETGVASRAFREEQFERFVSHIAELGLSGQANLKLVGMSLQLDGHPIAEQWGFVHKNRYYAFISGWDMDYDNVSPGKLHLGEVIKACYDQGLDSVDMMIPNVAYKQTWARETVEVKDYVMPISFKGSLYGRVWLDLLRPRAKQLFYRLPPVWRERLLTVVG